MGAISQRNFPRFAKGAEKVTVNFWFIIVMKIHRTIVAPTCFVCVIPVMASSTTLLRIFVVFVLQLQFDACLINNALFVALYFVRASRCRGFVALPASGVSTWPADVGASPRRTAFS